MGIIDKLKQEFDLSVEWLGFEVHPDTPQEGMLLSSMFPQLDAQTMFRHLRDSAAPYGIIFAGISRIANSRVSLEASEFAQAHGRFDQFHSTLFRTYFSEGMDIGNLEVLAQTGHDSGLDRAALVKALQSGKFLPMIENMRQEAARHAATAVPTFIIEDKDRIVGARPIDVIRKNCAGIVNGAGIDVQRGWDRLFRGLLKTFSYHKGSSDGSVAGSGQTSSRLASYRDQYREIRDSSRKLRMTT